MVVTLFWTGYQLVDSLLPIPFTQNLIGITLSSISFTFTSTSLVAFSFSLTFTLSPSYSSKADHLGALSLVLCSNSLSPFLSLHHHHLLLHHHHQYLLVSFFSLH